MSMANVLERLLFRLQYTSLGKRQSLNPRRSVSSIGRIPQEGSSGVAGKRLLLNRNFPRHCGDSAAHFLRRRDLLAAPAAAVFAIFPTHPLSDWARRRRERGASLSSWGHSVWRVH